jgi:S-adenosylmethionine-diacylgycerolhomoserine-N-methlytransferase
VSARADLRVLAALARGMPRDGAHAERLARFYAPQSEQYDAFRERLLHGRRELIERLAPAPGSLVVELGGGTGRNAEFFGDRLVTLEALEIVDVCAPLLEVARRRAASLPRLRVVGADAAAYRPTRPADVVYLSYSLSMMPSWEATCANALAMLRPGGVLGVVDFHVPDDGGWLDRVFWPRWFARDGVRLSPAPRRWLAAAVPDHTVQLGRGKVPYLAGLAVPYFVWTGRKAG